MASLIRHPNVVPVIDVVEDRGELLLVMEYVESVSFSSLLAAARRAGQPLPPPIVVRVVADCLSGLHAAHEAADIQGRPLEVVHRDVSPQNVIIGVDGTTRLIDFGIAKAARRLTATTGGVIKGKSGYMAPEQLKQQPLDRRADVFSAGVVLYVALTGRLPFVAEDEADLLLALLVGQAPSPSSLVPGLPPELDAVVEYAIAPLRDERFQTAAAFLQALETAVPPAPAREVARVVERLAGDRLATQRTALRAALEHTHVTVPEGRDLGAPAVVATKPEPIARAPVPGPSAPTVRSAAFGDGGGTGITGATETAANAPRRRARIGVALAAMVGAAALAIGLMAARARSVPSTAPIADATDAATSAALPTPPSSTASAPVVAPAPAAEESASASATPTATPSVKASTRQPPRPRPTPTATSELRENPYAHP